MMVAALMLALAGAPSFNDVPDLKPYAMRVYGVRSAVAENDTTVRVTFGAAVIDLRRKAECYRIISPDDPNYAYEKFVRPKDAKGSKERVEFAFPAKATFPNKADVPHFTSDATLTLPFPMKKDCRYAVVAQGEGAGLVTAGTCAAKFTYEGETADWDSPDANAFAAEMMGLRSVSSVGDGKILCSFGPNYSEAGGRDLRNWTVTVNGRRVLVRGLGRRSNNECFKPTGWGGTFGILLHNDIFLDLGAELKEGDRVEVTVDGRITTAAKKAGFTFSDKTSVTRAIKTNQVGYLPEGLKVAYLGYWLGSFPEADVTAADAKETGPVRFTVEQYYAAAGGGTQEERENARIAAAQAREAEEEARRAAASGDGYSYDALANYALRLRQLPNFVLREEKSGEVVFTGRVKFEHNGLKDDFGGNLSAENVYTLDFTSFDKPGRYYLSVEGVGRSLPFDIGTDVYERAFQKQAQGLYEQRCGCELDPKLTGGWKRIACHAKGINTTTVQRSQSREWGDFRNNLETDPNPDYPAVKAAREKVETDPSVRPLVFTTVGATKEVSEDRFGKAFMTGEGKENGVTSQVMPDAAKGCTLSFYAKRIDSYGGNAWFGSFFTFGGKAALDHRLGWGDLPGVGRINNGKWWHFAVRLQPADEKGRGKAELLVNGRAAEKLKWNPEYAKFDGTLVFGRVDGQAAEGTYYADIRYYDRALNDQELSDLTASVPETLPHVIAGIGGHHDAGDYNPRSHIDVAQQLMYAYELRPQNFTDSQLPIPERGNGIPDILDEALWAVKIWESLQDEDGGVRNGTESQGDPNFVQTVELDDKGDYAWAKDTKGSYLAAGTFAQASRLMERIGRRERAKELRTRAVRAYVWAVKNPTANFKSLQLFGEYEVSLRAYAAAELYHTTGEAGYHQDFLAYSPWQKKPNAEIGVHGFFRAELAAYSYALVPAKLADAKVQASVLAAIRKDADMYIRGSEKMAYKFVRHPFAPITWGTGAYENYCVPVAFVWALTGEERYREWLIRSCDNTLGANPIGISYITGLGQRTIRCPLHNSRYRADGCPVDGLQGQGPNQHGDGYAYRGVSYPWFKKGFGILQNLSDVHFEIGMDEPTVNNMANTMMIFGLLTR